VEVLLHCFEGERREEVASVGWEDEEGGDVELLTGCCNEGDEAIMLKAAAYCT
jgi:hypothetical protein